MNNETKAVDVLAVMNRASERLIPGFRDGHYDRTRLDVLDARAAVSALIGVAQSGKREGDAQERRQWLAELDAALARVQGGA